MIEQDKTGDGLNKTRIAAQRSVKKSDWPIEGLMNGITVKSGEGMLLTFESSDLLKGNEICSRREVKRGLHSRN